MAKSRKTQISAMLKRRAKHRARRKEVVIRKNRNERLPEYVPPKAETKEAPTED